MIDISKCPICGSESEDKQPEGSLHAWTQLYNCGSEVVYMLADPNYYQIEINCKEIKMNNEPKVERTTFSNGVLDKIQIVKENADKLEGNTNRLNSVYFGINQERDEDAVKSPGDFSSVVNFELDDINKSILSAIDFITKL